MLRIRNHYFEQNELLLFSLDGEMTTSDLESDILDTLNTVNDAYCRQEVIDCRNLEISDTIDPEALVTFSKKLLTFRDCEMLLLIPADNPLHEGMAEALAIVLANKRKRIWIHYTIDEAVNLLNLIQHKSPEPAIRHLRTAV